MTLRHGFNSSSVSAAIFASICSLSLNAQIQFEQWRTTAFTPAEAVDDLVSGILADPDSDGQTNLQEYAFKGSPKYPDPLRSPSASLNVDHLTISFIRPKNLPDVTYITEVSSDLVTWSSGSAYTQQIAVFDRGDAEAVVIQDLMSLSYEPRRFMRIRVNREAVNTGLVLWLDAGAGITKSGTNAVSAWADKSGLLNHAAQPTSANAPLWIDNAINNRPAIRFDGVDDQLNTPTQLVSNDFTLFAVIKTATTHEIDTESTSGTAGNSGQHYLFGTRSWGTDAGAGLSAGSNGLSAYEQSTSYMPAVAVYSGTVGASASLVALKYSNKKSYLYVNGLLAKVGLQSPKSAVWSPSEIGAGSSGAFQGDVAEILLYNRTLSSEEIARVDTYLSGKYGLQINPVVSITAPTGSISFGTDRVDVQGTVTHSLDLDSLDVNGVHAFVSGNNFVARNIPVQPGLNVITAVAKDISGHIGAVSVNLNVANTAPVDPVLLEMDVESGFGPLTVQLTSIVNVPGDILEVWYDFDGDGSVDQIASSAGSLFHTYATEGNYFPVVTVVTTAGTYSSAGGFYSTSGSIVSVQPSSVLTTTLSSIATPVDLKATPDGNLYVLSKSLGKVIQFDTNGTTVRTSAALGGSPTGLDVDAIGRVYVALNGLNQVVRLLPDGSTFSLDFAFNGTGKIGRADAAAGSENGEFYEPYDVAVYGDHLYVTDRGNHRIQKFSLGGVFRESFGEFGALLSQFSSPKGIILGADSLLHVVDAGNNRIVAISDNDSISSIPGNILGSATGGVMNLGSDIDGLYIVDSVNNRIRAIALGTEPSILWTIDSSYGLFYPQSVTTARSATSQFLFVADTANNRIVKITITRQNPLAVWTAFKAKLGADNIEGALSECMTGTAAAFREAIDTVGPSTFYVWLSELGTLVPVKTSETEASYQATYVIDGVTASFLVSFVKENGKWKLAEL